MSDLENWDLFIHILVIIVFFLSDKISRLSLQQATKFSKRRGESKTSRFIGQNFDTFIVYERTRLLCQQWGYIVSVLSDKISRLIGTTNAFI